MKKALFAALCFIIVGFMMVNGTFAQLDWGDIFKELGGAFGAPTRDPGKMDVDLVNAGQIEQLYPGGSATCSVAVKNEGSLNACFRLAFAVQYDAETWDMLTFRFSSGEEYIQTSGWTDITVGGTPYRMQVFTFKEALAASSQSSPVSTPSPWTRTSPVSRSPAIAAISCRRRSSPSRLTCSCNPRRITPSPTQPSRRWTWRSP